MWQWWDVLLILLWCKREKAKRSEHKQKKREKQNCLGSLATNFIIISILGIKSSTIFEINFKIDLQTDLEIDYDIDFDIHFGIIEHVINM